MVPIYNVSVFNSVAHLGGDVAEVGVAGGKCFVPLICAANEYGKTAHAFDSFVGMDEPGEFDGEAYPKGRFSVGGVEGFRDILSEQGVVGGYELHEGYTPKCFKGCAKLRFCFAVIDLDHYQPTIDSFNWIVKRMVGGGKILFDDYFKNQTTSGASKAISELLGTGQITRVEEVEGLDVLCVTVGLGEGGNEGRIVATAVRIGRQVAGTLNSYQRHISASLFSKNPECNSVVFVERKNAKLIEPKTGEIVFVLSTPIEKAEAIKKEG